MMQPRILTLIVVAQFFCTSLWFAGNAVMSDLVLEMNLTADFLAHITSAVQFGFISGTLVFALLTIADRYSPSRVFFVSAVLAALFNALVGWLHMGSFELLMLRFMTGFFLAGIYPIGMKIASDYSREGLGKSLGFLVGALVLGTAFPHLLKSFALAMPWRSVMYGTSLLSILGGVAMHALVPDGPFRKAGQRLEVTAFLSGFRNRDFRAAAIGYFGHMWELYAFWAFVPVMLTAFATTYPEQQMNVSRWSFIIIGFGALACVMGGYLAQRFGAVRIATGCLILSGLCCLLSPIMLSQSSSMMLLVFLFVWGLVVIADSPLFSTLIARYAPAETRGTALTIVNCIGFSITIVSIQLLNHLMIRWDIHYLFVILAAGPIMGVVALFLRTAQTPQEFR
ncbi:MAG TPA: MFS transporter [Cyclobacteriaceae bacterium]|nr:MFS transporter [Cyclobacteriaceae bacterium]